jgi:hypothetical protein
MFKQLSEVGLYPKIVAYEPFVKHEKVREAFYSSLGLSVPVMSFYDANEKYNNEPNEEGTESE